MKTIFTILIISLLFLSANAQKKLTDREFDGLKGKVKSVAWSATDFETKDGKTIEKKSGVKYEEQYDENGNISMTLNYIIGDKNIYSIIDGNKTFKSAGIDGFDGSGISSAKAETDSSKIRDERYLLMYKYKYDDKKRVTEQTLYSNTGELHSRRIYKYDEKGRITEKESYNTYNSDKITSRSTMKYDNENNLIEENTNMFVNNRNTSQKIYSNYKFDSQGNWIERSYIFTFNGKRDDSKTIDHRTIIYY